MGKEGDELGRRPQLHDEGVDEGELLSLGGAGLGHGAQHEETPHRQVDVHVGQDRLLVHCEK